MTIHLFAVARDIVGSSVYTIDTKQVPCCTVGDVRRILCKEFPELLTLRSFAVAVNQRLADDTVVLTPHDEVAIIPPMSGG